MSEITLEQLYEMQKALDERIIKEKGLEGQDLLPQKILALQVELGECANEWRGFKYWSDKQQPKHGFEAKIECDKCSGKGFWFSGERVLCKKCNQTGKLTNPLLEEYIDCLHFILSIGIDIGFNPDEARYLLHHNVQIFKSTDGITQQFNDIFTAIAETLLAGAVCNAEYESYEDLVLYFIGLGEMLGFTWEQIEAAYMDKNKINHERQSNGY